MKRYIKKNHMKKSMGLLLSSSLFCSFLVMGSAYGKSLTNKYSTTENGHMPTEKRAELSSEVQWAQQNMTQERYAEIARNPESARSDQEKLAALAARQIFFIIDRSGSMESPDENPAGSSNTGWTRWKSAQVATESIGEVALALDADAKIEGLLFSGDRGGNLVHVDFELTSIGQIADVFQKNPPGGTTPLAKALAHLYQTKLKSILQKSEPFTVIMMTDGSPDDPAAVRHFIKTVIKENNLETPGRETLAAFSFVRMGDDAGAEAFLEDLDDNLIRSLGVTVDIVDTKEDNFLFGTGKYRSSDRKGPFALFWDAIYD